MFFKSLVTTAFLSLATLVRSSDIDTIEIVGNKFYFSNNGSQFYIKGVAYQADVSNSSSSSFDDPLADASACERDIPYLQELNTNVIRVYAVNASLDHSDCMSLFQDAGIYVMADLSEPTVAIDTTDPSWTVELYERYTAVVDMFQEYDNVLGFFAGNEVITNSTTSDAAPFVKAAIRDMRQYMSDQGYRAIPIGYAANDASDTRVASADYFNCGDDDVKADFYGINMYEWCGDSSFSESGYEARTEEFSNLTIPVFFSEYGCNTVQPRTFTEVETLYSDDMTDVWSGGIVYMYFEETNDYGLVTIVDDEVSTLTDFKYLKSEMASIDPTTASTDSITASTSGTFSCPTTNADWEGNTALPPTPNSDLCDCVESTAGCTVDSSVDSDDYADLFSYICGEISCDDISTNGTTGEYGDYSFCSAKIQLIYMLNKYYEDNDSDSDACSFDGSASVVDDASTGSSCKSLFKAATASSSSGSSETTSGSSSSASGSGSSSSSASSSSAASIHSKKYMSSLSEITMTVLASGVIMMGVVVFGL